MEKIRICKDYKALIIDWGNAYQASTSVLEPALEGAAVHLDLGKSSSFHRVCLTPRKHGEKMRNGKIQWLGTYVKLTSWQVHCLRRTTILTWFDTWTERKSVVPVITSTSYIVCQIFFYSPYSDWIVNYLLVIKPVFIKNRRTKCLITNHFSDKAAILYLNSV